MSDPYAGARAAVASWTPPSASPAVMADGTAPGVFAANEAAVGIYDATRGALVATYPGVGYSRWLEWISTKCTYVGQIDVYYGAIEEPGRITSYGDGSLAEYDPNRPRYIPQGAPVFVVWTVPNGSHTASCKAGFRQADS